MRILVLGEGTTDLGRCDRDGVPESEGVLPILVRKLLESHAVSPIEIRVKRWIDIRLFSKRISRSATGFANKLRAALKLEGRQADAIIAVVDRDGTPRNDRIQELSAGRESLREAKKPVAVGVAIEMIEAWLLADEHGLRVALDSNDIQTQPEPESLSAREESSANNPKGRLNLLMREALGNESDAESYGFICAAIAKASSIDVLERRCSDGFAPFAKQVRELIQS